MYLTVQETAEYLSTSVKNVAALIMEGKIRAVYDGNDYLIYKEQFTTHFEQVEKYQQMIQDYLNEPIPEDIDIKDED
jgi:excisionase family DNA binding protein